MSRNRPERAPAEPWRSFLAELNAQLESPVDFHCIGGFVVSQYYGLGRETADLDILSIIPKQAVDRVSALAGRGSQLQKKHRVCIDYVQVANYPDSYEGRLIRAFPFWANVRLWALEPHDLALTKLERSSERDIRDVMYLAQRDTSPRTLCSRVSRQRWNHTSLVERPLGTTQPSICGLNPAGRGSS